MRIVHLCHDYWPAVGGSELLLKEVSERLVAWGEEVRVFTSNAPCSEAFVNPALPLLSSGEETIGGVRVTRFPISRRFRRPLNLLMQTAWRLRLPFNDLVRTFWNGPTCPRMVREIVRAKPDLVVATAFPFQTMYYPFMARLFRRFPIVLIPCFHPSDPWSFDRPIMEKALKAADAIVVLTKYERDHLLSMGVQGEKLHVVGVGTDPECFKGIDRSAFRAKHEIRGADPMIAFVGRMEPGKGVNTLLDAMPRVWQAAPTARLVLAGPSTYYSSAVNAKVAALPREAQGKVLLLGIISEEEKRELLVACDLLALPSRVESFGIVYLEAWACGKPVIGCRTGAVSSVIEDEGDGLLVTYGDVGELAGAIIRLLSDEPMRQRLGEKGRAKVLDRYNWDRIAKEMRELYCQLMRGRGSSPSVDQPMIKSGRIGSPSSDQRAEGERWKFAQQMEREFWLNLDEETFRACEEGYRGLATDLARHTRTHLGHRENIRMLQIGCAVEDAVMYFPYGQRFAIDPLADFYIRHFERSRNPHVTYFTAIGEAIPFAADVFDLMICNNVLDHMLHPEELLREVRRTLKSDGIFYLSVDVYSTDTYLQRKKREANGEVIDPCHPHTFTVETLREMVAAARFHVLVAGEAPSGKGDESVRYCMTLINEKKLDEEAAK